jgi:outer membrane receptor protein involved in Fe transport
MKFTLSRRSALLGTTLFAGLAVAGGAWAQAAPAAPPEPSTVQELVVTGTRIPRPNLKQPTPVSEVTPTIIQQAGPQSLGDIIAQLPALGPTSTLRANSNNFGTDAGVSSIDLRNLGTSRTLVLVDGQRHVNGDINSNAVDINSIPTALVDHVEVITGGASAIYGSDAVSGVVNIILKKRFEGLEMNAQVGGYDQGFGQKYSADITAGRSFLDDRLNVTVTGFWRKEAGVDARNIPEANNYATIHNPNDLSGPVDTTFLTSPGTIPNDHIPDRLFVPNVGISTITLNGALISLNALSDSGFAAFAPAVSFDAQGNPVPTPFQTGFNSAIFGQLHGCVPGSCFFLEDVEQEISPNDSKGAQIRLNYDVSDHLHAFLDGKFVQNDISNTIQPSSTFLDYALAPDNAFITPAIAAAMAAAAVGPDDVFLIGKFINPNRTQDIRRRTYRVVAGLNGDFDARFANVRWDGAVNYGRTEDRFENGLELLNNFDAALDSVIDPATGQPACRISVPTAGPPFNDPNDLGADETLAGPGCVPYNPFGQIQLPGAMAYSFGVFPTKDTLSQEVANINASFDTSRFFNLQGGPIGVAVGAEYRMERTKEINDPALVQGLTEALFSNSSGGFNVKEAYVELNLPVFKDYGPLLNELSFDVAYRGADYSTVGKVGAYKFSATYGPASFLKLRGTYSRAIRAPNITEAFQPPSPGFFNITDPCSAENINTNVNFAKNCAAAGIPAGFVANTNGSIEGQSSGNPDLDPEKSISYTAGIVVVPPGAPNLSITLDYYAIKIKNAITEVDAQDIIDNCFGSATLDPNFCSLFTRGPDLNIDFVKTTFVNASKLTTDGWELRIAYQTDVSPLTEQWRYTQMLDGTLTFDLDLNYVHKLNNFPFQTDPTNVHVLAGGVNNLGDESTPYVRDISDLTYRQGPITANWQVRYVGRGALFDQDPTSTDRSERLDIPYAEATFYHDISLRYKLGGQFGRWVNGTEVFVGVNNLFNEEPPFTVIGTGSDLAYDLGRFIYAGVTYRH